MKHLISMKELGKADILRILETAAAIEAGQLMPDLSGVLAALLFFEPSTRTSFSFDTAIKRLGGSSLVMNGSDSSSMKKGESYHDTITTVAQYADILVVRSPMEGAARYAADVSGLPVINAGDGANQHPSQALLDLYSIQKTQGTLENLTIGIMGDLKFGRTVHSLVYAMAGFNPRFAFISPKHLRMPAYITDDLDKEQVPWEATQDLDTVIHKLDILYVTRVQRERFTDQEEYERSRGSYVVNGSMIQNVKPAFRVMHPLPRVDEISTDVDQTPYAYYFQQAKNGVAVRQALFTLLSGKERL